MHKLENETRKILWDLKILIDPLIPAKRPDLVIVYKRKTCTILWDLKILTDPQIPAKAKVYYMNK